MFRKGQQVRRYLSIAGLVTFENAEVLEVRQGKVWLDNGPGNDPSGPFDSDGRHEEDYYSWIESA